MGSWAAGGSAAQMRPALGGNQNANSSNAGRSVRIPGRAGNAAVRFGVNGRGTKGVTGSRLHRGQVTVPHHQGVSGRGAAGYPYGGKVTRNKNRKTKKEKKSSKATASKAENDAAAAGASNGNTTNEAATENEVAELTENLNQVSLESSTVELQNG